MDWGSDMKKLLTLAAQLRSAHRSPLTLPTFRSRRRRRRWLRLSCRRAFHLGRNLCRRQCRLGLDQPQPDRYWARTIRPSFPDRDSAVGISQNNFLGGAQIGVNWQFQQFVVGGEGDFLDATAIKNSQGAGGFGTGSYSNPWMSTFAARFGWAADHTLFYGKAGGAYMQEKYNLAPTMAAPSLERSIAGAGCWAPASNMR